MTLLVSLVAVVAAAGVTGLRKDVQKTACLAGAGIAGDTLVSGISAQQTRFHFNEQTERCDMYKNFGAGNQWASSINGVGVFLGSASFNVPF